MRYPRLKCLFCGVVTEQWAKHMGHEFPACMECRSIVGGSRAESLSDRVQFVKARLEVKYGAKSPRWLWSTARAIEDYHAVDGLGRVGGVKRVDDAEKKKIERRNKIHARRKAGRMSENEWLLRMQSGEDIKKKR
jgi:hypothetical protein